MDPQLITVFGGTGFLGSALVHELVDAGQRVRIATRSPAFPGGMSGSDPVELCEADIRDDASVAVALEGADSVVNAVSLYVETRELGFDAIHVEGAGRLARLARLTGIERLVQISGIGASSASSSAYVRARGRGETAVLDAFPKAIILRPSVMFGPGGGFLATLSVLTRLPVIPLFSHGETRLQPVHVVDVARALIRLLGEPLGERRLFELGGPDIMTYREIVSLVMAHRHRERLLMPLPFPVWRTLAALLSVLPDPPLTRDQVILMERDNVVGEGVGRFEDLAIRPRSLRDSLPECLPPD
jgi:NADH dehydrogenase